MERTPEQQDRHEYYLRRKERVPEQMLKYHRTQTLKKYNLTLEQYEALWQKQDGKCGICGLPETPETRRLQVDHDHSCCPGGGSCGECVRGLLCLRCNTKLGFVEEFEMEIYQWLQRPSARSVER